MNSEQFLNSIVTVIDSTGDITNYKKEIGTRHIEVLTKYVEDKYPHLSVSMSDIVMYETICKNDNILFLNFGKTIVDGGAKYEFYMIAPDKLTKEQKDIIKEFKNIKEEYISSLTVWKYDKEKNKLIDLNYNQKLKYEIDELELMMVDEKSK